MDSIYNNCVTVEKGNSISSNESISIIPNRTSFGENTQYSIKIGAANNQNNLKSTTFMNGVWLRRERSDFDLWVIDDDPYIEINDWLKAYLNPQQGNGGSIENVPIPQLSPDIYDGYSYNYNQPQNWYTAEYYKTVNRWLYSCYPSAVVNTDVPGCYTDENGYYWVAIGPMVVYPDQPLDEEIRGCMIYGKATIDVRITRNNMDYFIRCVPGDVKAHTYPNGIVQTWKTFRDDYNGLRVGTPSEDAPQYEWNEVVCVEFIGRLYNRSLNINKLTGMSNYCISEFIVYYNELNE